MKDIRRKKLLILAHYYPPDVASTGQIISEFAESLSESFSITVICAIPSYSGIVSEKDCSHRITTEHIKGIEIVRVKVSSFDKTKFLSRLRNLITYYFNVKYALKYIEKPDCIFAVSQPPVLGGILGVYAKKKFNCKLIYNIQDFNPELIEKVRYLRSKLLINCMRRLDNRTCRKSEKVVLVGRDMTETFAARKINVPYTIINNWCDESKIYPLDKKDERIVAFKKLHNIENKFIIMYSGNLGLYYDLENIIFVCREFQYEKDVLFVFVGGGALERQLKNYVKDNNLANVAFIPYQDKDNLIYSLNCADVHMLSNSKGIKGISIPSKMYGILACGKYVIGILEHGSEAAMIIEESGCGKVIAPGDSVALKELFTYVINNREKIREIGMRGRKYLEKNFKKNLSIQKYRDEILKVCGE